MNIHKIPERLFHDLVTMVVFSRNFLNTFRMEHPQHERGEKELIYYGNFSGDYTTVRHFTINDEI